MAEFIENFSSFCTFGSTDAIPEFLLLGFSIVWFGAHRFLS
jgi:hypothetical protein